VQVVSEKVRQIRLVIVERDLLLRCPRCAVEFDDYDNCNALTCGKCGAGFCALCLVDCGADAHDHIRQAHPKAMFDKPAFEAMHRKRRAGLVVAAVRALASEGESLQRALVAELSKADLPGLGISPEDVLRDAKVALASAIRVPTAASDYPDTPITSSCHVTPVTRHVRAGLATRARS
jgi:hypothetical protein